MDGFFDFFSLRTEERLLKDVRILGLDVETTGLDSAVDEIIEIGIAGSHGDATLYERLIRPTRMPLTPKVTEITGITPEDLMCAEPVGEYLDEIGGVLDGSVIVMHNADFDLSFLRAVYGRRWDDLDVVVIDTLRMSREHLKSERYSLSYLAALFGLSPAESHRAAADAATCLRLFHLMVDAHPEWLSLTVRDALGTWVRL